VPTVTMARVNFSDGPDTVFDCLREVSPHSLIAEPRMWEKLFSRVVLRLEESTPLQRWTYGRALRAGYARAACLAAGRNVPAWLRLRYRFWERAVLRNLRRMLGLDRLRRGGTGGAPIAPDLLRWFRAVGIPLYESYGRPEATGLIAANRKGSDRIGSVGKVIAG